MTNVCLTEIGAPPIGGAQLSSRGARAPSCPSPWRRHWVYQDHLAKFVILRPLRNKTAEEVVDKLLDIFCLFGPPHILRDDDGKEFKNVNLATIIWEKRSECKLIHGKLDIPNLRALVKE